MSLTEMAARKAKPREKAYKLADADGLYLHIQPGGSKLWRMKYRFAGKEKSLSFGPYPLITIAAARRKRDEAKQLLYDGMDPSEQKRQEKLKVQEEAEQTFGLIAEELIERMKVEGASPVTIDKTKWLLLNLAKPLCNRPVKEITAAEILDLLKRIERGGKRETARRLRGRIGGVFRLAIVTLRADADPTVHLRGALLPPKVTARAAITDEYQFGKLLSIIDEYDGWPPIRAALQLLALTCVRPGEIRNAKRAEFDLKKGVWHIPAERMKMRVPHDVPLSRQALRVLGEVWL